jgi:alpha-glucosidase
MAIDGSASAGWTICFGAPTSTSRQSSQTWDRELNRRCSGDAAVGISSEALEPTNVMQRGLWWQTGVIYQIYPRSFQDSNGDGIGDLRGITQRLPYLVELGVDAIWLSPIFPSPIADFGYDISDYTDIDPIFGSLSDFDALLTAAHAQGIKVILDLVPNHTSDRHPWFLESRASRGSRKRDWYIWRDPAANGGPPNNWLSVFGGSAWQYDRASGQYYYHAFLAAQPDLNWCNPAVRSAIYEVMRFWFRRGVDGFRIDVIWHLIKDEQFRDNPPNPNFRASDPPHHRLIPLYTADRPEVHDVIAELRRVADEFSDRVLIGEIYLPLERLVAYYGRDLAGVHLPFNFSLLSASWDASSIARLISEYEAALPAGGWPNWVLGNHDRLRIASRVGASQARIAAILLLTLRGTPTIYYGDEIAMNQVAIAPDEVRDPMGKNIPDLGLGRDGCRTPMQWDSTAHAGFSTADPWLPVGGRFAKDSVVDQRRDKTSIYQLYRRLIDLRRKRAALLSGSYGRVLAEGNLLVFTREIGGERILVALNFGDEPVAASLASGELAGRLLVSSAGDREGEPVRGSVSLRAHEGMVVDLTISAPEAWTS